MLMPLQSLPQRRTRGGALPMALWLLGALCACSGEAHRHSTAGEHEAEHEAEHVHHAPRGGKLIVLADEFANLELLFDPAEGRIDLYALDGEAEAPVRTQQPALDLQLQLTAGGAFPLSLAAVASPLTGETVGDTSHFSGMDARLVGAHSFKAVLNQISARGQLFSSVAFEFP